MVKPLFLLIWQSVKESNPQFTVRSGMLYPFN